MRVFNSSMIIMKRRVVTLVIYFVIFTMLNVVMTTFSTGSFSVDFEETKPNYTIINRDGSTPLINGLTEYLSRHGEHVELEDTKEALQDATFFHATDYILIIPEGFSQSFNNNGELSLESVTIPDSARGYYVDNLTNRYLNNIKLQKVAGQNMTEEEIIESVLNDLSLQTTVNKKVFGESSPISESYQIYHRTSSYIILVLTFFCVGTILMTFRRVDLRMRNKCGPLKPRNMSGQLVLCGAVVSFICWIAVAIIGFILYGSELQGTDWRLIALTLLNSFVFMIVALSITTLAGFFVKDYSVQNAVGNLLSLGLCFLGGTFVPLDMLGDTMIKIARFLPTYWYMITLDNISQMTVISNQTVIPIFGYMLVQLGFAAAIFCIVLAVGKYQGRSEKDFGTVRTEIEAF